MAEEQISIRLTMATVPALPAREFRSDTTHRRRVSSYRTMRLIQQMGAVLLLAALCYGSYYAVSHCVVKSVRVVGTSMVPTLQENATYFLNVWAFHDRDPARNEIVVHRDPADHGLSVKRIIAVGGESVHFKDGKVLVNGRMLDEPYLLANTRTFTYSQAKEQLIIVPKDAFYVLGDNRIVSIDSRAYGPVPRENILGLVKPPVQGQ
jgi:signal peptidase I